MTAGPVRAGTLTSAGSDMLTRELVCTASRHGTAGAYTNAGCTCPTARRARYQQRKRRHLSDRRFVDPTGTRRRLEALAWMGWTRADIAVRAGLQAAGYNNLLGRCQQGRQVELATARTVAAVFEQLCMTEGPCNRARIRARKAGYLPPLAWDDIDRDPQPAEPTGSTSDSLAVDLCCAGTLPAGRLTPTEHEAVVTRLNAFGLNDIQIAARVGLNPRSVHRIRQRCGVSPPPLWRQNRPDGQIGVVA